MYVMYLLRIYQLRVLITQYQREAYQYQDQVLLLLALAKLKLKLTGY
jgi:hypothetical protein